jgi:hypothetical protein
VAFEANYEWLVLYFSIYRPDLDALPNISVAQAAKLWSNDILKVKKFGLEEIIDFALLATFDLSLEFVDRLTS